MNAKRYFQLSYIWPVVLPVAILALPGNLLPDWINQLCRAMLRWTAIPSAVFAAVMLYWSRNKEADSVRRSTYLSPLLFFPAVLIYLVMAGGVAAKTYSSDAAAAITWLLVYGFLVLTSVLTLGYTYVGVMNFVFVLLRSCGAFEDDDWLGTASRDPYQSVTIGATTWPSRQASCHQSAGGLAQPAGDVFLPGSPYCFVSWEAEKSKGASPARPASEASTASSPDQTPMPDQTVRSSEAPQPPDQTTRSPGTVRVFAQPAPRSGWSSMPTQERYTAPGTSAGTVGLGPKYEPSCNFLSEKPHQTVRSAKPQVARDPLRTALLALLAPLIILSAFAIYRHYGVSARGPAANHRVWHGVGGRRAQE